MSRRRPSRPGPRAVSEERHPAGDEVAKSGGAPVPEGPPAQPPDHEEPPPGAAERRGDSDQRGREIGETA